MFFEQAVEERVALEGPVAGVPALWHARIPAQKAREFCERVMYLDDSTAIEAKPGKKVHGLVIGAYLADLPEPPKERG